MDPLEGLAEELTAGRPAVLVTVVAAPAPEFLARKLVAGPAGHLAGDLGDAELQAAALGLAAEQLQADTPAARNVSVGAGTFRLYVEPYLPPHTLLVVGSGHVAMPLAAIAKLAGFRVVVLDDRPEYANAERFPAADEIRVGPFVAGLQQLPLGPRWYAVLVTRGHTHDLESLRVVLDKPLAYLGMIGSGLRVKAVFEMLRAEGVEPALLERVHAPIGLDIGAETPGEIAVAIAAELIKARRGGTGESLSRMRRGSTARR